MSQPDLDPEQYPSVDPSAPIPDDPRELSPQTPDVLPEAPVEPEPGEGDAGGDPGGVREPA